MKFWHYLALLFLSAFVSAANSVSEVQSAVSLDVGEAETAVKSAIGSSVPKTQDDTLVEDSSALEVESALERGAVSKVASAGLEVVDLHPSESDVEETVIPKSSLGADETFEEEAETQLVEGKSAVEPAEPAVESKASIMKEDPAAKSAVTDDVDGEVEEGVESRIGYTQQQSNCPASVKCQPGESCTMYLGYPNCFVPATVCKFMPCLNGGTCINDRCVCVPPYSGKLCGKRQPIVQCPSGYCQNGGSCYTAGARFRCHCLPTHTGPRCGKLVPATCPLGFCRNGGSCYLVGGSRPLCLCPPLFTGLNCERSTESQCPVGYCLNGGTCLSGGAGFRCLCPGGWDGPTCQFPSSLPTICNGVACNGDCACEESSRHEDGYVCISNAGYLGRHCTIPVPELHCTPNEIVLTVAQAFYAEWDMNQANSVIYMSPTVDGIGSTMPQCRAQLVGSTYRIAVSHPFTQCGIQTATDVGPDGFNRVSFTNALWINKNFGSSTFSYDMPFGIIRFKCVYANSYTIYTSIRPIMDEPPIISDELEYQISATLCKVSTCNEPCPAPLTVQQSAVYTVGQMIHLDFGVFTPTLGVIGNLPSTAAATIQHAVISCSASDPFGVALQQGSQFQLFDNGCPTEHGIALQAVMGVSTLDHRACFSFRLPRSRVCTELYIHAQLHVCAGVVQTTCLNGASSPRCSQVRRRRSNAPDDFATKPVVIGPVYVLEEEQGVGHVTFVLDNKLLEIAPEHFDNDTSLDVRGILLKPAPKPETVQPVVTTMQGFPFILVACGVMMVLILLTTFLLCSRRNGILKPDSLGLPLRSL